MTRLTDIESAKVLGCKRAFKWAVPFILFFTTLPSLASSIGITNTLGSGDVVSYNGEMTVAQELLSTLNNNPYRLELNGTVSESGNTFSRQLRYVPSYGPLTGDILTFTLNGAKLDASNIGLYAEEAAAGQGNIGAFDVNNDGDTSDVVEVASLFASVDPVNGYDTFVLRFNNGLTLPSGIELILQVSAPVDTAPSDGEIDDRAANSPALLIDPDIQGAIVTLSVSATNLFGIEIPNADASGTIIDLTPQFSFNVSTPGAIVSNVNTYPGTSIIDVGADAGTEFAFLDENPDNDFNDTEVKQGDSNDDTDLLLSAGFLNFGNNVGGTIEDTITLTDRDELSILLTSTNGLGQLDLLSSEVQVGTLAVDDLGYTFSTTEDDDNLIVSEGIPGDLLPTTGNEITDKLIIAISGDERVEERQWFASAMLDFTGVNQRFNTLSFSPQLSHIWESNATTLETPYVNLNPSFNSRIIITNTSNRDVTYEVFAQAEADAVVTLNSEQQNGTILANTNIVLFASDLIDSVDAEGPAGNRASISIVLAGPTDELQGIVQFIDPNLGILSQQNMLRPGTN